MKIADIIESLHLKVFTEGVELTREIKGAYVSDLLSDVMGFAEEGQVWITVQSHLNTVAIASLKDMAAIIFVKDITPAQEVVKKAENEKIVLLGTEEYAFEVAGQLYEAIKNDE